MYIIGSSTLAEIAFETLTSQNIIVDGFFDDFNNNNFFLETPVLGSLNFLINNKSNFIHKPFFVAIGNNEARASLQQMLMKEGFLFNNIVHSQAIIEKSALLGQGNFIGCFAYIGTGAKIGNGNIIFKGVSVTHHNILGDYNFLSPNVSIGGFTRLGDKVKVGMNSVIKPYIEIESGSDFEPLTLIGK